MAVETLDVCVSYSGNGATTVFPYDWLIAEISDIYLQYTDATGLIWQVPGCEFTVIQNTNADGSYAAGGTVLFEWQGSPIPTGSSVLISRYVYPLQSLATNNQDGFFPETYDGALDRLTMVDKQLTIALARALLLPLGDAATGNYTLPGPTLRANTTPGFDANGNWILNPTGSGGGGGGPTVPTSAPLLGSTSSGSLVWVAVGAGLTMSGETLNATAVLLPANAAVLDTDPYNNAIAVTLGAGLSKSAGTLAATAGVIPASASLLASNAGGKATAVALGSGVAINSGTLTATAAAVPSSQYVVGSNAGGTIVGLTFGQGIGVTGFGGGTLYCATPVNALLLGTGSVHGQFVQVALGSGLTMTTISGTKTLGVSANAPPVSAPFMYTSAGGTFLAGTIGAGLAISGSGTLSSTVASLPANAAVLSTNSGGTATALALGAGLASSGGTLSATATSLPVRTAVLSTNSGGTATALVLCAGLASCAGTLSATAASVPANAPVLSSNSGGTLVSLALGAGLSSSGGTLSATAASPPVSASFLYRNSGGTLLSGVVGLGLAFSSGTLTATGSGITQIVATGLLTGGTITTTGSIGLAAPAGAAGTPIAGILSPPPPASGRFHAVTSQVSTTQRRMGWLITASRSRLDSLETSLGLRLR